MEETRSISIVGCGPGSREYLTPAALRMVEQADLLVGSSRLLDLFPSGVADRIEIEPDLEKTLDYLEDYLDRGRIAVLVSGDPGLHSLARRIIHRFGRSRCRVIPGVSSVQAAFAAIGLDWTDALILSAHSGDPQYGPACASSDKIAVLCGRTTALQWVACELLPTVDDPVVIVCENLTLENERVFETTPETLGTLSVSTLTIVLLIKRSLLK